MGSLTLHQKLFIPFSYCAILDKTLISCTLTIQFHGNEVLQLAAYWHPNSSHWHALLVIRAQNLSLRQIPEFRSFYHWENVEKEERKRIEGKKESISWAIISSSTIVYWVKLLIIYFLYCLETILYFCCPEAALSATASADHSSLELLSAKDGPEIVSQSANQEMTSSNLTETSYDDTSLPPGAFHRTPVKFLEKLRRWGNMLFWNRSWILWFFGYLSESKLKSPTP